jgi:hypothetical protein
MGWVRTEYGDIRASCLAGTVMGLELLQVHGWVREQIVGEVVEQRVRATLDE